MDAWLNNDKNNAPVNIDLYAYPEYSTYQQVPVLQTVLRNTKPDLVILAMCLNDTEDWGKKDELLGMKAEMRPQSPTGWVKIFTRHSYFGNWLYRQKGNRKAAQLWFQYYKKIYSPDYSGWKKFSKAANRFKNGCETANVPLIVVIFPLFSHGIREGNYPLTYCHDALKQTWSKQGVLLLDLFNVYRNMSPMRLQVIPGMDPHPSEIAHRIAAHAIIRFLVENNFLEPRYRSAKMYRLVDHVLWSIRLPK